MELRICHLYPDVLNLYGDRGNILCMEQRLRWRGIEAVTAQVPDRRAARCGGIRSVLHRRRSGFRAGGASWRICVGPEHGQIRSAIEDGKTFLAICGGYQMLGQYYKTWDGVQCDFTGALDLYTVGSKQRMIGNYMSTCDELPGVNVVGFENHSGKTYLGSGVKPLGHVLEGYGNNGEDKTEGARYRNVFATYSHGCLLPKNPALCDHILKTALTRRYGEAELTPLDDALENAAHSYMENRLSKK